VSLKYKVRLSRGARVDLVSIRSWLTQPGSGSRGRQRYAAIIDAIKQLSSAPHQWGLGKHPHTRERPVERHRIIYETSEAGRCVDILRIFGPFQDRSRL
jgi:plasmid stabilization system protein ParE